MQELMLAVAPMALAGTATWVRFVEHRLSKLEVLDEKLNGVAKQLDKTDEKVDRVLEHLLDQR